MQPSSLETSRIHILKNYCRQHNLSPAQNIRLGESGNKVTVVVPAYNEEFIIAESILSLGESEESIEIVVVDNNSSDKTVQLVKEISRQLVFPIIVLDCEKKGPVFSRKKGIDEVLVQHLSGKNPEETHYVAMTDADTRVPQEWATLIYGTFERTLAAALGGAYRYSEELDSLIEYETGWKEYFGTLAKMIDFLNSHHVALIQTNGSNSAIEIGSYALIGGSQQPVDENGKLVKGSDLRFGEALRAANEKVEHLPCMTVTSARRAIYSLRQGKSQASFSSMESWVDCRLRDHEMLQEILPDLSISDLKSHADERAAAFLYRSVVLPLLLGKLSIDGLVNLSGQEHAFVNVMSTAIESAATLNLAQKKKSAQKISTTSGLAFLTELSAKLQSN